MRGIGAGLGRVRARLTVRPRLRRAVRAGLLRGAVRSRLRLAVRSRLRGVRAGLRGGVRAGLRVWVGVTGRRTRGVGRLAGILRCSVPVAGRTVIGRLTHQRSPSSLILGARGTGRCVRELVSVALSITTGQGGYGAPECCAQGRTPL
ncbi:hypothetical protein [Streptomyces uncialis]|uniref:hypothetical protein n=1 Tax=Streptomyces uncialis TaxID=1048205 RepID=UPI00379D6B94